MESDEHILEAWTDDVLLIQCIKTQPGKCIWQMSHCSENPPGHAIYTKDIIGITNGTKGQEHWNACQITEEFTAWRDEISVNPALEPIKKALYIYSLTTLSILYSRMFTSRHLPEDSGTNPTQSLRCDAILWFNRMMHLYREICRPVAPTSELCSAMHVTRNRDRVSCDDCLTFERFPSPTPEQPLRWQWYVSLSGKPMPGAPFDLTRLPGLNNGRQRDTWDWQQLRDEFESWITEIDGSVALSEFDAARYKYAVKTLLCLSTTLETVLCKSARHNALRHFIFFCLMYQRYNCVPSQWLSIPNLGGDTSVQVPEASRALICVGCGGGGTQ